MARPLKNGVEYFPKDADFYQDDKVRLLRAEFGCKGMYILDYILCEIYRNEGYYLKWDKNKCFLVSDGAGCGCSPDFLNEFISGCIRCSFFDERVFNMFGILSSAGIQRRYIRMFKSRELIRINSEYWLLDISDKQDVPSGILNKITFYSDKSTENPLKSTENPLKSTDNAQSKVKVKEKENNTIKVSIPCEIQKEWKDYEDMRVKIRKPMTDTARKLALSRLYQLSGGNISIMKAILNQSVFNSWQGLFQLKEGATNGYAERGNPNGISETCPTAEIL